MANEDFTTYDETDEGNNITVIASKISWADLTRANTSHVSDSKGVGYFGGDFTHQFECQESDVNNAPWSAHWGVCNFQDHIKGLIDADRDAAVFHHFSDNPGSMHFYFFLMEAGEIRQAANSPWQFASGTTYFVTITRDDDGGANNTGQYVAKIRTGSHEGALQVTMTIDAAVGWQKDFEFIYGMASWDDNLAANTCDGFTQNLNLTAAPTGADGAMTTNTGFWGQTV